MMSCAPGFAWNPARLSATEATDDRGACGWFDAQQYEDDDGFATRRGDEARKESLCALKSTPGSGAGPQSEKAGECVGIVDTRTQRRAQTGMFLYHCCTEYALMSIDRSLCGCRARSDASEAQRL
jgi:hypothetical protein